MDKFDDLAKRLRARVERSASRERSLDWKAADAIDHLQAECERLAVESKRLEVENRSCRGLRRRRRSVPQLSPCSFRRQLRPHRLHARWVRRRFLCRFRLRW